MVLVSNFTFSLEENDFCVDVLIREELVASQVCPIYFFEHCLFLFNSYFLACFSFCIKPYPAIRGYSEAFFFLFLCFNLLHHSRRNYLFEEFFFWFFFLNRTP